ncbi:MAG TPA: hypothetical protein VE057_14870 [Archangium sp.]|nr:hypothetical protein [Archangium sp.]
MISLSLQSRSLMIATGGGGPGAGVHLKQLFSIRTIGHHGVRWEDVRELARFKHVFRPQ